MVEPLSPMAHDELNINQQGFNSHDPCPGHGKPSRSEALTQPRRGTGWDRSPLRSFGANIHAFQWGLKIQQHFLYKKMINNKMGMQAITTNVSSENWKGAAFNQWRYRTSRQKHPNGPEIGPAFSSFSMIILFSSRWNLGIATCLHSWWFLLVLHFHWDSWKPLKTLLLLQREFKNACSTPPKSVSFFEWFCVSLQRQHFFTLHTNLRTVLAVMSQTSAFLYMYRHCQALTYVMITGLWLGRLPGSIFLQAFQQFFPTIVPVWASTFGLPRCTRRTVFVQRNMKCLHRSAKDVCNVTWHVFSVHQRTKDVCNATWSVLTKEQKAFAA